MHNHRLLSKGRLDRFVRERIGPALYVRTAPLTVEAWPVPGRTPPCAWPVREPDQDPEEHRLGQLPFYDFAANQARANIAALASNLVSWLQLTALPDGHQARTWDIKRWRYRLFATAGKIITRASRRQLLLPESAPEKGLLKLLLENTGRLKRLQPAPG